MNDEYTYDEELKLSADIDLFEEYRFSIGIEDRLYEAASGRIASNPTV